VPQLGSHVPPPGRNAVLLLKNIAFWVQNQLFSQFVTRSILAPVLASHNLSVKRLYSSKRQRTLTLVNTHPAFDWARPLPPHVHYVGPLFWQSPDEAVSSAYPAPASPFVIISFGTLACLSESEILAIVEGLSHLHGVQIIWKLTDQDLPSTLPLSRLRGLIPAHVALRNWIDQVSLLNHDLCVGFLTHGGINGLLEAASAGKPVAVLPLIGDQEDNAEKAVFAGYGIRVSTPVTAENIKRSVLRLLHDDVLAIRARQLSVKIAATSTLRAPVDKAADLVEEFLKSASL
jgi:UDP:flavonoid glycosyltransferase YjiC (YdhE family)